MRRSEALRAAAARFAVILCLVSAAAAASAETLRPTPGSWPIFRGDGGLSGVAPTRLPVALKLRWVFKTGGPVKSSAVIEGGRAIVGSSDGKVYALDLATGRRLWDRDTGSPVEAPPVLDGEAVYVGTLGGLLLRLDAATGRTRWKTETGGQIMGSANVHRTGPSEGAGKPPRATVVVGSYDGSLYGVDARNGRVAWTFPTGNFINGAPAVVGNLAVFGGCDGLLHAVSLLDGKEVSAVPAGSYVPAISGRRRRPGLRGHRGRPASLCGHRDREGRLGDRRRAGQRGQRPRRRVLLVARRRGRDRGRRQPGRQRRLRRGGDRESALDLERGSRGRRLAGHRRRRARRGNHGRPARGAGPRRRQAALVVRDRRPARRLPGGRRGHGDRGQRRRVGVRVRGGAVKIALIAAGAGPRFYCENCARDDALARALGGRGHEVAAASLYLPPVADAPASDRRQPLFYGAVSLYLRHRFPSLRSAPRWVGRLLDSPPLLRVAGAMAGATDASGLADLTLSMLRGEEGGQAAELEQLVGWLRSVRPDAVHLSNCLLMGVARRVRRELGVPVLCTLQDEDTWIDSLDPEGRETAWQLLRERAADVDLFLPVSRWYARFMAERMAIPRGAPRRGSGRHRRRRVRSPAGRTPLRPARHRLPVPGQRAHRGPACSPTLSSCSSRGGSSPAFASASPAAARRPTPRSPPRSGGASPGPAAGPSSFTPSARRTGRASSPRSPCSPCRLPAARRSARSSSKPWLPASPWSSPGPVASRNSWKTREVDCCASPARRSPWLLRSRACSRTAIGPWSLGSAGREAVRARYSTAVMAAGLEQAVDLARSRR